MALFVNLPSLPFKCEFFPIAGESVSYVDTYYRTNDFEMVVAAGVGLKGDFVRLVKIPGNADRYTRYAIQEGREIDGKMYFATLASVKAGNKWSAAVKEGKRILEKLVDIYSESGTTTFATFLEGRIEAAQLEAKDLLEDVKRMRYSAVSPLQSLVNLGETAKQVQELSYKLSLEPYLGLEPLINQINAELVENLARVR